MSDATFRIEDYGYFRSDDPHDPSYDDAGRPWSRPYEYLWALNVVRRVSGANPFVGKGRSVLNAAWGYEGCHLQFRTALDGEATAIHTDLLLHDAYLVTKINAYNRHPTLILNLATPYAPFIDSFDVALCVSVVEHMPLEVAKLAVVNLLSYVKPGGIVGLTFDLPSESGAWIVGEFGGGRAPETDDALLSGANSVVPNPDYAHLRVGRLLLRKVG